MGKTLKVGLSTAICSLLLIAPGMVLAQSSQTAAGLQQEIQALIAQLNQQLNQMGQGTASTSEAAAPTPVSINISSTATAATNGICPNITRTLTLGSIGVDVDNLQGFLAQDPSIYPSGTVSGYFGSLTQKAVQAWQAKYNIVTSGSPGTTGWGVVGPHTASAIKASCTQPGTASLQCPVSPQPASVCPGTWSPVRDQNGCVDAWECSFPLPGVTPPSSSIATTATTTTAVATTTSPTTTSCVPYTLPLCQNGTIHWNGTDQHGCNLGYQCI